MLAHGGVDGTLSPEGLSSYFFSDYVHPPHTIVRGVKKLPPGHTVVWERGHLGAPRAFWQVPLGPGSAVSRGGDESLARELWRRLGDAVEAQLVSDVPVGIFLSGGIDSSCVAALRSEARARPHEGVLDRLRGPRPSTRATTRAWSPAASASSTSSRPCARRRCSTCSTPRSTGSTSRSAIRRTCRPFCSRGSRPAT